jgi:hypothetical protein
MKKKKQEKTRRFDGPLFPREDPVYGGYKDLELKEYFNMEKKHLKAYLRGDKFYFYKGRQYKVSEEWAWLR